MAPVGAGSVVSASGQFEVLGIDADYTTILEHYFPTRLSEKKISSLRLWKINEL
jgi:hypothetical protein